MLIAAIADLHGNKPALDAVMDDMPAVDQVVCAGDVVGYNPWPAACIDFLRDGEIPTVQGNHDRAVAHSSGFKFNSMAQAGVTYATKTLSETDQQWLATLPERMTAVNETVHIVHGHPDDPNRYTYPEDFHEGLLQGSSLLVLGHTHVQYHEVYEDGIVLNPGSVGQPRDGDHRAAYSLVDLDTLTVEERRVSYDIDVVCEKIAEVGLPQRLCERLRVGS